MAKRWMLRTRILISRMAVVQLSILKRLIGSIGKSSGHGIKVWTMSFNACVMSLVTRPIFSRCFKQAVGNNAGLFDNGKKATVDVLHVDILMDVLAI